MSPYLHHTTTFDPPASTPDVPGTIVLHLGCSFDPAPGHFEGEARNANEPGSTAQSWPAP